MNVQGIRAIPLSLTLVVRGDVFSFEGVGIDAVFVEGDGEGENEVDVEEEGLIAKDTIGRKGVDTGAFVCSSSTINGKGESRGRKRREGVR